MSCLCAYAVYSYMDRIMDNIPVNDWGWPHLRTTGGARLSLIEDLEKVALENLRKKHEGSGWHRESRDHGHDAWKDHIQSIDSEAQNTPEETITSKPPLELSLGPALHNLANDPNAPKDKYYFVLIIVFFFGLVHMLPFGFMMTATEYWLYKFRDPYSNSTDPNDRTYYQANFGAMGRIIATGPGVFCTFAAALIGHKVTAQTRIFMVLIAHTLILLAHAIFTMINTDDCAISLGGSGSMGLISKLPPVYMKAQLLGDGGSNVFSSVLRLVFIFITTSVVNSARAYFLTGVALMAITSILFYFAIQTPFFRYYTHQRAQAEKKEAVRSFKDCKEVFLILWPMLIIGALPLFSPTGQITGLVVSEYFEKTVWGNKFFVTTCTYLIPSITGIIGRALYNHVDIDCPIPLLLVISLSKEIIFGALTFVSRAYPRHHMPILLTHDWEYGLSMALSNFLAGFLTNLCTMKIMRMCPPHRIELGMMVNMCVISIIVVASSPVGRPRLSLIEDLEKVTLENLRKEHDGSNQTGWHKHARDHGHDAWKDHKPSIEAHHTSEKTFTSKEQSPGPALHGFHNSENDPNAPKDKYYFVLIIVCLFGLVHMLPFGFLMTATEYWMYKLRDPTSNSTDPNDRTYYQANFGSLGKLISTGPGVFCNFAAALIGHKIKAQTRIFLVLTSHTLILLAHTVFAMINTDEWQKTFFYSTICLQMLMMCALSLGGSGSMGLISKLPPVYMKAQLIGDGGSQVFSAVLRLAFIFITTSVVSSARAYFITGVVLMAITSILFYFAVQTPFFRYYTHQISKAERKEAVRNFKECKEIFLILWPMLIISCLPMLNPSQQIIGLVVSENYGKTIWGDQFFVTTCTYLIPSITGIIGRGLYNYFDIDCPIPLLFVLSLSREIIFGTGLFLSRAYPRKNLPVVLSHDWEYGLLMALNHFTSGFLTNLCMMKLMRMCPPHRIELGMMVNMCIISIVVVASSPLGVLGVSLL